jgi:Aldo/keto reductase family
MRALDDAVRAGRVLYIGISDTPAWVVARANTLAEWPDGHFAGLQVPYSLLKRDIECDLLPMAEAFGMTLAAWSPLAGGVLSGKFTRHGEVEAGTRISPESIGEHDRAVAQQCRTWQMTSAPPPPKSRSRGPWRTRAPSIRSSAHGASISCSTTWAPQTASSRPTPSPGSKSPPRSPSGSPQTSSPRSNHGCSRSGRRTHPSIAEVAVTVRLHRGARWPA